MSPRVLFKTPHTTNTEKIPHVVVVLVADTEVLVPPVGDAGNGGRAPVVTG